MFKYILFDLDGTLTDPKIGITTCVQYALASFGIHEPCLDKLEPFIGPPLKDSFMHFYGMNEQDAWLACEKYRERFATTGIFENEIYPGIATMLEQLCASGKKLAIASSKPTNFVEQILQHFNIAQYFTQVVGSEAGGKIRSSKQEVVEETLHRLLGADINNISKNEFAMVGDRKFDIEGAKAFGLTSIGVSFGYASPGELENAGADFVVNSVAQLQALLNQ